MIENGSKIVLNTFNIVLSINIFNLVSSEFSMLTTLMENINLPKEIPLFKQSKAMLYKKNTTICNEKP